MAAWCSEILVCTGGNFCTMQQPRSLKYGVSYFYKTAPVKHIWMCSIVRRWRYSYKKRPVKGKWVMRKMRKDLDFCLYIQNLLVIF